MSTRTVLTNVLVKNKPAAIDQSINLEIYDGSKVLSVASKVNAVDTDGGAQPVTLQTFDCREIKSAYNGGHNYVSKQIWTR